VDEHGFVLDILLQRQRNTEAAMTFLIRLLGEYAVPEVIHTDQLRRYRAAIREDQSLADVDHQQGVATAVVTMEQEHQATKATPEIPARTQKVETRSRIPEFACPDYQPPPSFPTGVTAAPRRNNQGEAFQAWTSAAGVACSSDYPCPQPAVTPDKAT